MSSRGSTRWYRRGVRGRRLVWLGTWVALAGAVAVAAAAAPGKDVGRRDIDRGRDLFIREWLPGDAGGHPGDGLGPVYNDTSCVACHNLGGVGVAGPSSKNVDLLTAVVTPVEGEPGHPKDEFSARLRERLSELLALQGTKPTKPRAKGEAPDRRPLVALHAGFRDASSLVLHRFGSGPDHEARRIKILSPEMGFSAFSQWSMSGRPDEAATIELGVTRTPGPFPLERGHFTLIHSQRNPAPLFGVGLIDAIPDRAIEEGSRRNTAIEEGRTRNDSRPPEIVPAGADRPAGWRWRQRDDSRFPEIKGRVCRLENGRIGRFGWKAEQASLEDFVLTACAVELGLEVPGRHQGIKPDDPEYRSPGLDLTREECAALVAFVRGLPAPVETAPSTRREAESIRSGRESFERIGCAACHRPKLGPIDGIYSDLLLHDMGDQLGNTGSYGLDLPDPDAEQESFADARFPSGPDAFAGSPPRPRPASRREWRTPPLWGIRDSGPYLHDGRAETLEQAIALHDGEARATQFRYFRLTAEERIGVQSFLKALVAPGPGDAGAGRVPAPDRSVPGHAIDR